MNENILHPNHYVKCSVTIEPIVLTNNINSAIGQALQYVMRRKFKGNELDDLGKAFNEFCWYKTHNLMKYAKKHYRQLPIIACGAADEDDAEAVAKVFMNQSRDPMLTFILLRLLKPIDDNSEALFDEITDHIYDEMERLKEMNIPLSEKSL